MPGVLRGAPQLQRHKLSARLNSLFPRPMWSAFELIYSRKFAACFVFFLLLRPFAACFAAAPVDLSSEAGGQASVFLQESYMGAWRMELLEPGAEEVSDVGSQTLLLKPGGLASKVLQNGSIEAGQWVWSQEPVEDLLADGMLLVSWGDKRYEFVYRVGGALYARPSEQKELSKSQWDDLPVYLLSSESAVLGVWSSRGSDDAPFHASLSAKAFMGYWELREDKEALSGGVEIFELLPQGGGARLHSRLGMSLGSWFLEDGQLRVYWQTGVYAEREDIIRALSDGFEVLRYARSSSEWNAELVSTRAIVRLDDEVGRQKVAQISSTGKRKGRSQPGRIQAKKVIPPGYYCVVFSEDDQNERVEAYFHILSKGQVEVYAPPLAAVAQGASEQGVLNRGSKGGSRRIIDSLLIEWETGVKELIYPIQRGFYLMETFAPGGFMDEAPMATFSLYPLSEEAFKRALGDESPQ